MGIQSVIIDTDVGTDDAMALLIFLLGEKLGLIRILGILTTNGNTTVENVVRNTARIFNLLGISHIPIFKGISEPLINKTQSEKDIDVHFHGVDGFGDLNHSEEPNLIELVKEGNGIVEISKIIENNPDKIDVICLGPLTSIAIMLKMYKDLKIKSLAIMGGNFQGIGNITSAAEYNFHCDPEAARIVFETVKCSILLLPWEPCLNPNIPMDWRLNLKSPSDNAVWLLLTEVEKKVYAEEKYWLPCDSFLAACYLFPERMIVESFPTTLTIETSGQNTRGQTVIGHKNKHRRQNVQVISKFCKEEFQKIVYESIK